VEGTGSFGASLSRYLLAQGVDVFDVNRMDRAVRCRRGKSDPLETMATSGPGFGLTLHPSALGVPFRWRAPRMGTGRSGRSSVKGSGQCSPPAQLPSVRMELPEQGAVGASSAEDRGEAAEAVAGITGLVLTATGWERVRRALDRMESAVVSGNAEVLNAATGQLELATPARIRTLLGEEGEPAPRDVLERADRLVHALRSEAGGDDRVEGEPTGDGPH
jgi:hypothetical protein